MGLWRNGQRNSVLTRRLGVQVPPGLPMNEQDVSEILLRSYIEASRRRASANPSNIKRNAARCRKCGETIESKYRHDYVRCSCGSIAVDGGFTYIRRAGNPDDIEELSEYIVQ